MKIVYNASLRGSALWTFFEWTLLCNRICMLGDRLLTSKAFSQCSKNDTGIKKLFEHSSFWNTSRIKNIDGAPGLSSGVFDGKPVDLLIYVFQHFSKAVFAWSRVSPVIHP